MERPSFLRRYGGVLAAAGIVAVARCDAGCREIHPVARRGRELAALPGVGRRGGSGPRSAPEPAPVHAAVDALAGRSAAALVAGVPVLRVGSARQQLRPGARRGRREDRPDPRRCREPAGRRRPGRERGEPRGQRAARGQARRHRGAVARPRRPRAELAASGACPARGGFALAVGRGRGDRGRSVRPAGAAWAGRRVCSERCCAGRARCGSPGSCCWPSRSAPARGSPKRPC